MLRELAEPAADDFGWGYNGGGTSVAAAAILADALLLGDPGKCGIGYATYPEDEVLLQLREDFCDDLLSQLCDQWRLRRGVVLRWSFAWYLQRGINELPAARREDGSIPRRVWRDTNWSPHRYAIYLSLHDPRWFASVCAAGPPRRLRTGLGRPLTRQRMNRHGPGGRAPHTGRVLGTTD
ncbi:hypothetical protein [Streptomyces rochei]|uniref:hypothetical protein n=1 Tax=Streptomyces rochei TaxID=1928 RepID=UPI0033AD265F